MERARLVVVPCLRWSSIALAAVAALMVHSRPASACSPGFCFGGHLIPGDGAKVPANLPGLYWDPMQGRDNSDPAKLTLATVAAPDAPIPLTPGARSGFLVPDRPLVEGTSYVLSDGNTCLNAAGPRATFQVRPAAAFPAQLGALHTVPRGVAKLSVSHDASCSTEVSAVQTTIELDVAPEAAPWFDVLHFETYVDGKLWAPSASSLQNLVPGTSWRGRGTDLVYRVCGTTDGFTDTGLAAGAHEVTIRATFPGSFAVMSSSTRVELSCDGDPPASCDSKTEDCSHGGCSAGGSPALSWLVAAFVVLISRRGAKRRRVRHAGA